MAINVNVVQNSIGAMFKSEEYIIETKIIVVFQFYNAEE